MAPNLSNLPIIFIVGGPGSGKSTQCDKMRARYNLTHLSLDDLTRDEIKSGSALGKEMEEIMKAGKLVPQKKVLTLLKNAMEKAMAAGTKGFLIDGYPREVEQGVRFEADIAPCAKVIYFEEKELVESHPVVEYYRAKGKLIQIPAEGSIEEIFEKVCAGFDPIFFE